MLDIDKMKAIATDSYTVAVTKKFGVNGGQALRFLIEAITSIYQTIDISDRILPLVIFIKPIQLNTLQQSVVVTSPKYKVSNFSHISHELNDACFVEVSMGGGANVFDYTALKINQLSSDSIIYILDNRSEKFIIGSDVFNIINPSPAHISIFARPTFSSLSDALNDYHTRTVRSSSCFILEEIWSDNKRIFLKDKPESTMRRSLHQYLRTVFTNAEVRPEQVVDESHPVDIKITWFGTNHRALIEIKWLGQSRDATGKFTTPYTAARAKSGAKQLADYLDANQTAGPGLNSKGYLVVFDARRKGLNQNTVSVTAVNGLHYRDAEIIYNPEYHHLRDDFAPPIRMFAEPLLN